MTATKASAPLSRHERHQRALQFKVDMFDRFQNAFLGTLDHDPSGCSGIGAMKKLREQLCSDMPFAKDIILKQFDRVHECAKKQVDLTL